MTTFQREFLINSLMYLETILSIDNELNKAVLHFTQGNFDSPRYQYNSRISNAEEWSEDDKLKFTSALAEAIARTSEQHENSTENITLQAQGARTKLLEDYVPLLTADTNADNRLKSVKANSLRIRKGLIAELKSEVPKESQFNNPLVFFPLAAATVTVATVALSLVLK
ncbi:hypothetical protein EP47_07600 [Legionella norrlandica]|uniref:Uncharacterized protein n=1 Tax=Legionella norrlandica TaxID=1498499 RepID=A0A0A2T6R2_9GAMM|nr:hypothetical protein [Legionella norrlandica]KGP63118.1 hypothetical protein EP47_07600 [Legionella norrlandica]